MGRGDKRTKRGKIFRSSFGKCRPKHKEVKVQATEEPTVQTEEKEQATTEEQ